MTWKREFAGRRIKCKRCGFAMFIPSQPARSNPPPPHAEDNDLYSLSDLAADAHVAAASLPPTIVEVPTAPPRKKTVAPKAAKSCQPAIPLAYQFGATHRDVERAAANSQIDPKRDLYVPIGLILAGTILYLSFYTIHYDLRATAMVSTSIGLTVMTLLETAVLFGFALTIASPLGVSFGGIGSAILKFAAIATFCDGTTAWVDGLFAKYAGNFAGGGLLSFGVIGFPVALGIYWTLLIYLFSMDPGDSWMVVVILAVFQWILRLVLVLLLLRLILSFGGVAGSSVNVPSFGGAAPVNPQIDVINDAKAQNVLHEARKYIADNNRSAESGTVEAWYDAGAPNVWFQTDRDINGHGAAFRMVVELPTDPPARAKCFAAAKTYYNNNGESFMAQALTDNGDPYLMVPLP
jgi:hypothetical protein